MLANTTTLSSNKLEQGLNEPQNGLIARWMKGSKALFCKYNGDQKAQTFRVEVKTIRTDWLFKNLKCRNDCIKFLEYLDEA